MEETDAYEMGREAFYRGDDSSLNPFDEADRQRDEWEDGYHDSLNHKKAYDEILKHLQDAEMAAKNKQYQTSMTCANMASDAAKKWALVDNNAILNRRK